MLLWGSWAARLITSLLHPQAWETLRASSKDREFSPVPCMGQGLLSAVGLMEALSRVHWLLEAGSILGLLHSCYCCGVLNGLLARGGTLGALHVSRV